MFIISPQRVQPQLTPEEDFSKKSKHRVIILAVRTRKFVIIGERVRHYTVALNWELAIFVIERARYYYSDVLEHKWWASLKQATKKGLVFKLRVYGKGIQCHSPFPQLFELKKQQQQQQNNNYKLRPDPEGEARGRRRLSSNNSESCHGSTILVTFLNRVKGQIKREDIVVLSGKICPVNAVKVLPKHWQQYKCISFPFCCLLTKTVVTEQWSSEVHKSRLNTPITNSPYFQFFIQGWSNYSQRKLCISKKKN